MGSKFTDEEKLEKKRIANSRYYQTKGKTTYNLIKCSLKQPIKTTISTDKSNHYIVLPKENSQTEHLFQLIKKLIDENN